MKLGRTRLKCKLGEVLTYVYIEEEITVIIFRMLCMCRSFFNVSD